MSPPQPQPPHRLTQTPRDQSRPAHAPGNPSRCDHISQSVLATTSHTTTGCGTTGGNHPTVQTTRPMSPPQPQPPHRLTQTPRDQSRPAHAPGNPSRCDHISQSVLATTSHTTTGCGTTGGNHPTVQTTRPMSPPQPQPPHRLTQTPRDQSRPAHAPGNPSRCDHISQSVLATTSHTTTGCGTTGGNHPTVQTTRPMSPPQPQPPHRLTQTPRDQSRPAHAPGNPSRCDHISQSVLATTSHTTTGCGTTGGNHPTVQTTRPMSPPQPQPPHRLTQTPRDQSRPAHAPGNPSRCDHISQSVLATTSHTTTGCGTTGRNHPTVQTTRPMSPPQPQPPHRLTQTPRDQSRPAHAPGNPSRCDHISQSVLATTSHTTTGCGTTGGNHPTVQTTRPMSPPQPQPPHRLTQTPRDQSRPAHARGIRPGVTTSHNLCWPRPPTRPRGVVRPGGTTPRSKQPDL